MIMKLRPLEEQFTGSRLGRIRRLQTELKELIYGDGAAKLYVNELVNSLEGGLLLAAIHLTGSLLELFVRDLLLYNIKHTQLSSKSIDDLESILEDSKPEWSFNKILEELEKLNVLHANDVKNMNEFYKKVRIPIMHGITGRFVRGQRVDDFSKEKDIFDKLFNSRESRNHRLEEKLEDESIELMELAVNFMRFKISYFNVKL